MTAHVHIAIQSPLGNVSVSQTGGRLVDHGAEVELEVLVDALRTAIAQTAGAFGIHVDNLIIAGSEPEE